MDTDQVIREKRYGAKPRAGFNEETAQQIGAELERITVGNPFGSITAEEFVAAAESGEAPTCASRLTWDDTIAGQNWRLFEARQVLNHITLVEPDETGEETQIRAFHSVTVEVENGEAHKERRYVPLAVVREEKNLVEQVMTEARREFIRARRKLALYEDQVREHQPRTGQGHGHRGGEPGDGARGGGGRGLEPPVKAQQSEAKPSEAQLSEA